MEGARPAAARDVARVAELARLMRAELLAMKGGAMWVEREARSEPYETAYAALIADDDAHVVVGTIDEAVVGYAVVVVERLRSGERLGRITDLFVEPGARAVGVGEGLKDALVAYCEDRRCIGIDALALPGHRAAKNFFEESGLTARALIMHRSLRPAADHEGEPG